MSNVYSIRTKRPIEQEDFNAHRKGFPTILNQQIGQIMASIEYSLYTLAMSGFDIAESVMIVPFEGDPLDTVAVINVLGDKDVPKQRSLITLTHQLILSENEEDEDNEPE